MNWVKDLGVPPVEGEPEARAESAMAGKDRAGSQVLGVLAKRTYLVDKSGCCVLAPDQLPLILEPIEDSKQVELILADVDLWMDKLATDVVVRGHAWNHPGSRVWASTVSVEGRGAKTLRVSGARSCHRLSGVIRFSDPELTDSIPISYEFAYGGVDKIGEAAAAPMFEALAELLPHRQKELALSAASPWRYPRNRAGRGYVVTDFPEALEILELPNLEDPRDLLTPERLVVGDPTRWPLQPLPASFDWLEYGAFPRLGWFGEVPPWDLESLGERVSDFPEVRHGYAEVELFEQADSLQELARRFDPRALNGASLGLRFSPYLAGDEGLELLNLHPDHPRWGFHLPGEQPRLSVDDREGGLRELEPRLHTVLIEPEDGRVSLLWVGFAPAKRPYFDGELLQMPFAVNWATQGS